MRGLSLVAASGGHSSSRYAGLSLSWPLFLRSTGSRRAGSVVMAHGPSCSAACGIFPDQGSSPCPLHWQADSQPLRHQGSPHYVFNVKTFKAFSCSQISFQKCILSALMGFAPWAYHRVYKRWCTYVLCVSVIWIENSRGKTPHNDCNFKDMRIKRAGMES